MTTPITSDEKRYQRIRTSVCILAAVVAAFMGLLAGLFYKWGDLTPIGFTRIFGIGWGALTGVAAAVFYCRVMQRRAMRRGAKSLILIGVVTGIFAGVLSTTLLHTGLMVVSQRTSPNGLILGGICGVLVGLLMGAIFGYVFYRVAKSSDVHAFPIIEGGAA